MRRQVLKWLISSLASAGTLLSSTSSGQVATAYPNRTAFQMKGVFSDHQAWRGSYGTSSNNFVQAIAGNRGANTIFNMAWDEFQPTRKPASSCSGAEIAFDGWCFVIPAGWDDAIRSFTASNVNVAGIILHTPIWAAPASCVDTTKPNSWNVWCPPSSSYAADRNRFIRFIARRYNGQNGQGRIVDFVIGNEVNTAGYWRDSSCVDSSDGRTQCNKSSWINGYGDYYANAYDVIKQEQANARVLVSLGNAFFQPSETVNSPAFGPTIAGTNFLSVLNGIISPRIWHVAVHPYSIPLSGPTFSPLDYQPGKPFSSVNNSPEFGRVTFGNVGAIAGWLWQQYPNSPAANDLYLTEQGFTSEFRASSGSLYEDQPAQAGAICRSFTNTLGTPSVVNYIYHRLIDANINEETEYRLGLWRQDAVTAKVGWSVWATSDAPNSLACGYENLPNTILQRSYNPSNGRHWVSSRLPPAGYSMESSNRWRLVRNPSTSQLSSMTQLFECGVSEKLSAGGAMTHTRITADRNCSRSTTSDEVADLPLGPVGYAYKQSGSGRTPMYSCVVANGFSRIVTSDPGCEGQNLVEFLGYSNS